MSQLKYIPLLILFLSQGILSRAQSPEEVLEGYIQEGINENLVLRQEQIAFEKSLLDLEQARALFFPKLSFNASYTLANGGRTISIPVGDIVNPVYLTLNELTNSNAFSTLDNVEEQFLPNNFHETRLSFQQPLFNTAIYFQYRARKSLVSVQKAKKEAYENVLKESIAKAWYQYLQAVEVRSIYVNTRKVLEEVLRVNERLVEGQKATRDVVYRARAELSSLDQQLAGAEGQITLARAYFNFLLNRDTEAEIDKGVGLPGLPPLPDFAGLADQALGARAELDQLQSAMEAQNEVIKLERTQRLLPTVFMGGEAGFQGFGYSFENQDYWLLSFGLQWDLFQGGLKKNREAKARLEVDLLEQQYALVRQQIRVEVAQAWTGFRTATKSLEAARSQESSAEKSFQLVSARYKQQKALLLEYLDARNQLTTARLAATIARYGVLIQAAQLKKVLSNS